jgi:3-methyladenine DNA glycosylase AlkC
MRIKPINPVAKAMAQSRRRTQIVPDKTKYNRKKDKHNANKIGKDEVTKD